MTQYHFEQQRAIWLEKLHTQLDELLPQGSQAPTRLHQAMRYSLMAKSKRLRPLLVLGSYAVLASDWAALPAAAAIECIHTYSLIHDDLPAMDNSDLRRGLPSCHKAFDEPTAILAGDGLLTQAFFILSTHYQGPIAQSLIQDVATACNSQALIGGQMEDILAQQRAPSLLSPEERLRFIHYGKTAALIACSLRVGLRVGQACAHQLEQATYLGEALGFAFQIQDDYLDIRGESTQLGKQTGQDAASGKLTYPSLYGVDASLEKINQLRQEALDWAIKLGGNSSFLYHLVDHTLSLYRDTASYSV